jgi:3-oxoacyl-[acyl-carrier-protein] synthase II
MSARSRSAALAITGASMHTVQGCGREAAFARLCEGADGVRAPRLLDRSRYRAQHAYEIDDGAPDPRQRATRWLVAVIADALAQAALDPRRTRLAVVVGTGLREQASLEHWAAGGPPMPLADWDFAAAVEEALGAEVPVHTLVNACGASLAALALGQDLLALGQADAVVVAGTDSIAVSMYGLLDRVSSSPAVRIEPFETSRTGVVMGEGAAAIVLQAGVPAHTLAWLRGTALNCDAAHETAPDPAGVAAVMRLAQADAGLQPQQVGLVMAHGTGTLLNDSTETRALAEVFDDAAPDVMLLGLKSLTGHTAGASGLVGLVAGIEILRSGRVPPTLHLREPIRDAARFDFVTEARTGVDVSSIQINAFGFGGVNAVALITRQS